MFKAIICLLPESRKYIKDKGRVKVKFILEHATKAQRGSRIVDILFL
jgi:hypothetical protein